MDMDASVIEAHRRLYVGSVRVDLFALRAGGLIDGEILGPIAPGSFPLLEAGETYLLETVVRTLKLGHLFTQGTADSNEVWLDLGGACERPADRAQRRAERRGRRS